MIRVRCSYVGQIEACAASAVPPSLKIVSSGEPARLGNAAHESQSSYAMHGIKADAVELGQKHRCDADELGYLLYAGRVAWDSIRHEFPETVRCEEEFSWVDEAAGIVLTGHPDVFSADLDHIIVADWKSGFLWSDCVAQLKAYCWLLAQHFPARRFTAFHVNLRRGEVEKFEWSYDELAAWWGGMTERIINGREAYSPGYEACRYCPRFNECEAGKDLARSEIAIIAEHDIDSQMSADNIATAYQRAKFVAKICEAVIENTRLLVAANGPIVASDGRTIGLEKQKREKIDAKAAWAELSKVISSDAIMEACTLGKGKALDAVRATAPRGKKKELADDVMARLRDTEAVSVTFVEQLGLRKAPQMIEQTV